MASAASIELLALRSSEWALQRPLPAGTRQMAQMILRDHQATSAQISLAGRRLNLLPSATLLPQHQAMLASLQASGDAAASYRQLQLALHREAERLHAGFATHGSSPTLRGVARATLPAIRTHLRHLGSRP